MKKLITICLLIVATFTVKAQTKEETISWLKEKFSECIKKTSTRQFNSRKLESINECEIIFSYYIDDKKCRVIIPTKNIYIDTFFFPDRTINNSNTTIMDIPVQTEHPIPV
ncbi:MAG: hypothetical protein RL308_1609 [Bacteroidota bacterium]|jgi:hypothetical protein